MEVERDSLIRQLSGLQDSELQALLNQSLDEAYSRIMNENDMSRKKERIPEFGVDDAKSLSMINSLTNSSRFGAYSPFQINLQQIP